MSSSRPTGYELHTVIVSWNRPRLLARTLRSICQNTTGLRHALTVVDNGSDYETVQVLALTPGITHRILLDHNVGINAAIELALAKCSSQSRYLLVSDADMLYRKEILPLLRLFDLRDDIAAVSLQHSPEHHAVEWFAWNGEQIPLKRCERGCALLFKMDRFEQFRPLPIEKLLDFDWWVMRDSEKSIQATGQYVAVVPGAAIHLGWRAGDSTWQEGEITEYEEYRNVTDD